MATEKEKFLAGDPYLVMDPELTADETKARRLCKMMNELDDTAGQEKESLIKKLFGSVGKIPGSNPIFAVTLVTTFTLVTTLSVTTIMSSWILRRSQSVITVCWHPTFKFIQPIIPWTQAAGKFCGDGKPVTLGNDVWVGGGRLFFQVSL